MITHTVKINGIEVAAQYSESAVNGIFLPLLRKLTAMQQEAGRRILVMLAAPPGAGKSTLLSFLNRLAGETDGIGWGFSEDLSDSYYSLKWVKE